MHAMVALSLVLAGCAHQPGTDAAAEAAMLAAPLDLPPLSDGRARFREIYCAVARHHAASLPDVRPCEQALVRLAGEPAPSGRPVAIVTRPAPFQTVLVPGLLGECVGTDLDPFADALDLVESLGYPARVVRVGGRSSSTLNAKVLADKLLQAPNDDSRPLVLIGHSKGAVDILQALVTYPAVRQRVVAVVSVAAPIRGSTLADDTDSWYVKLVEGFPSSSCSTSDRGGVQSVSTTERVPWLQANPLPRGVRYFSLGAIALDDDVSTLLKPFYAELSKRDRRNDGQVIYNDAVIPNGTLLGYARADHFAVAVPFARQRPLLAATLMNRNAFPRAVLLESILRFVEEQLSEAGRPP